MTLGIPHLLICDDKNQYHFVELVTSGNVVRLSSLQIACTRHSRASVWVLVRSQDTMYLYAGSQAVT